MDDRFAGGGMYARTRTRLVISEYCARGSSLASHRGEGLNFAGSMGDLGIEDAGDDDGDGQHFGRVPSRISNRPRRYRQVSYQDWPHVTTKFDARLRDQPCIRGCLHAHVLVLSPPQREIQTRTSRSRARKAARSNSSDDPLQDFGLRD